MNLLFIPLAGVQNDEALFSTPFYAPLPKPYFIRVFHHDIPLMIMTYIGTLKTFLYWPVLSLFGSNLWTLRLPVALVGSASVYILYALLRRTLGHPAACWGALLLATDPIFLLTGVFDWGPVAIEHLLLLLSCLFFVCFVQLEKRLYLGWASFCLGLALWNKAIFLWAFGALLLAGVAVFHREIRARLTRRNLGVAAGAFLLGCLPFLIYNIRSRSATLRENVQLEPEKIPEKFLQLRLALNGTVMFGYMAEEEWKPSPKNPQRVVGRASVWLRDAIGGHRETYFFYLLGILLLSVPLWWRSRAAWFAVIFTAAGWIAMASTHDAGGAAHHVILLWPFPIVFAVAALRWRWILAASLVMNLLVLNQYLAQFERNGAANTFTDAILPLAAELEGGTGAVYSADWGTHEALQFLSEGRLLLAPLGDELANPARDQVQERGVRQMMLDRNARIVDHLPEREIYVGQSDRLAELAKQLKVRRQPGKIIADSNGRPVFEIFHYLPE